MKIQDAGMILEEQPTKVAEAVKLFLQGLGHTAVLLKKTTGINPKWMTGTSSTTTSTAASTSPNPRSVSLSATPIKASKAELSEPVLLEGFQDLKIKFSHDENKHKNEEPKQDGQLLPI